MNKNTTKLEAAALNHYACHEMNPNNGASPDCAQDVSTYVWADDLAADIGVTVSQAKGVLGSLAAKGLVAISGQGDDAGICFTEAGFETWKTINS